MRFRVAACTGGLGVAVALLSAVRAEAQLPNPSPAALGMAENHAAIATGYAAMAWNPAGLALREHPDFSIAILPIRGSSRTEPLSLGDIEAYVDEFLPAKVRADWIERIDENGGLRGTGDADVTYVALSVGRFGFQVGTRARGRINLLPQVAELILFGNAGRTGEPRDFVFGGSSMDLSVTSTAAIGYAHPFELTLGALPDQRLSVGAVLKYTIGHGLLSGDDRGGTLSSDPLAIAIEFPVVYTQADAEGVDRGQGVGLDLGATWEAGPFAVAAVLQNAFNTFEWDESQLSYRPGRALFDADTTVSELAARPFPLAAGPARARLDGLGYDPVLTIAGAVRPDETLTLTADFRRQFGAGLDLGPRTHVGIGAQFRPTPNLPVRAGVALVSGGAELAGGIGLELGSFELAGSAAYRSADIGSGVIGMVGVSLRGR